MKIHLGLQGTQFLLFRKIVKRLFKRNFTIFLHAKPQCHWLCPGWCVQGVLILSDSSAYGRLINESAHLDTNYPHSAYIKQTPGKYGNMQIARQSTYIQYLKCLLQTFSLSGGPRHGSIISQLHGITMQWCDHFFFFPSHIFPFVSCPTE